MGYLHLPRLLKPGAKGLSRRGDREGGRSLGGLGPGKPPVAEAHLRAMIEQSPLAVGVFATDGSSLLINEAWGELWELEKDGASTSVNVFEDDRLRAAGLLTYVEESVGGVAVTMPPLLYDPTRTGHKGYPRWLRGFAYPVKDEAGHVLEVTLVLEDVTERKEAEEALRNSEERFRALTQNSSDTITLLGADGTIRYQSPSIERILGYGQEELVGENVFDYIHPEDLGRVEVAFAEGLKDPRRCPRAEYRFRHKDGWWVWLESVSTNLLGDPTVGDYVVNSRDITERRRAEKALKEREQRFRSSFEDAAIGMALVATGGRWLRVNRSLCEIVGYTEEELLTKAFQDITHPDDLHADLGHMRRMLAGEIDTFQVEKRYLHKEGHVVWILLGVSLVHDEKGEPLYFILQIQDITERKSIEEQLQHRALHDPLTNLPNRQLLVDRLDQALKRTGRKKGRQVAVLFIDIDDFKAINDSLGHEVGDRLLMKAAERLRGWLRPEDTLARFGGDEFVVLMEDVENPGGAMRLAERLVEALREPFVVDSRELGLSVSMGLALGSARTETPEDLLRNADTAMYEAKEEGFGYRIFDPIMHERALRRWELENDLRRATEAEEFVLRYQPIVDLRSGEVRGVEALVRWEYPEQGLLNPSEFVPVAEANGLVVPMGEGVLEEACRRAKEWQERHPRTSSLTISVNLSARQLRHPALVKTVKEVLRSTDLEAGCLSFDITETVYIKALEGNAKVLDELKRLGVRLSIDDFGVGYSSLAYLKRLPADALKIDNLFVKGLGEDVEDTAIVRMTIELAHTLGMEVIAEGVESEEQAAQLKEMGCDMAQGFYFREPVPSEEVPGFLAR